MRQGAVAASAESGAHAAKDYGARKRAHLHTAAACAEQGLQFIPRVAEAAGGGWAPAAMKTWHQLSQCVAARFGEDAALEQDAVDIGCAVHVSGDTMCRIAARRGAVGRRSVDDHI